LKPKHKRLILIITGLFSMAAAVALILNNFNDNLVFFYSPTEIVEKNISSDKLIRVGGLILEGSVTKPEANITNFKLTDLQKSINVTYTGILPPMFREGQGMVARGKLSADGNFIADNLLTKHDEKYMPPAVAEALKKSGKWKGEE
jgi:cytochrome c-type biogenesis protein CcmE